MNTPTATASPAPVEHFRASPLERQVGHTPVIDLSHLVPVGVRLLAKAEWHNPGGSVKDRPALSMINAAIADGRLRPGMTLLDATSGNTGIAYAWIGAAKGFQVHLTMSEGASEARKRILAAYGAELDYTDPAEATDGAIERARGLAREEPGRFFYADQYNNLANPRAHETTTGPEIWQQTEGEVTHFVAGLGTTGTLLGAGRYLKAQKPDLTIVALQPGEALHGLEGLKHLATAIVPGIYDDAVPDQQIAVPTPDAYATCRRLARDEGLLLGPSGGAAIVGALQVAADAPPGSTIATILPDHGSRYLSEPFWNRRAPDRSQP